MSTSTRSALTPLALIAAVALQSRDVASQAISPLADYKMDEILQELTNPNASAEVTIPGPSGFDLVRPWPGEPVSGWKFAIDIKADVPVRDVEVFSTLARIAYVPPDSVENVIRNETGEFAPMDGTWYPCMHLWVSPVLVAGQKDDVAPDCSSHLSEECLSDLREKIATGFLNWTDDSGEAHCPPSIVPESCDAQMLDRTEGEPHGLDSELMDTPLNYLPLQQWFYDDTTPHQLGDDADYLRALRRVWVVGISWGYSNKSQVADEDVRLNTTLACLRAKAITPLPRDDPDGILDGLDGGGDGLGGRSLPVAWWSCVTFFMAVVFAMGL